MSEKRARSNISVVVYREIKLNRINVFEHVQYLPCVVVYVLGDIQHTVNLMSVLKTSNSIPSSRNNAGFLNTMTLRNVCHIVVFSFECCIAREKPGLSDENPPAPTKPTSPGRLSDENPPGYPTKTHQLRQVIRRKAISPGRLLTAVTVNSIKYSSRRLKPTTSEFIPTRIFLQREFFCCLFQMRLFTPRGPLEAWTSCPTGPELSTKETGGNVSTLTLYVIYNYSKSGACRTGYCLRLPYSVGIRIVCIPCRFSLYLTILREMV